MKREIWNSGGEEDQKKDSLYLAADIVKDCVGGSQNLGNICDLLENLYLKIEKLRKQAEGK